MGFWSATSIGVGAMIGAGLFALIGIAVDLTGKLVYLPFLIAGIIALLTTYSVSKLAVKYPSKGGRVKYLNEAFGVGIFSGSLNIMIWIGYIIVTALYARAFGEYSIALFGLKGNSIWFNVLSSLIVVLFVTINFIGASLVGKSEFLIVGVKVIILLGFGIIGLTTMDINNLTINHEVEISDLLLASGVIFMSYEGFGLVANTAEGLKEPKKNLPKSLFFSVLIVMLIYLLVSVSVIGNLSVNQILNAKEYVLAEAAKPILGAAGFTIMAIAALFSTSSAINSTIYGSVNMIQETAKVKQAPIFFTNSLFGNKTGVALLITGGIIIFIANLLDLESIAETGSMIFLIIYTCVNVANFILRKQIVTL